MIEVLIDTNVLVYGHDPRHIEKHRRAFDVLGLLIPAGSAVLSVQCLTEFYRAVRWKITDRLSANEALSEASRFARNCRVLPVTSSDALEAMRACEQYSMSFWDALIWAVAKENEIPYLLTEDFDDGANVEGVQFINPFTASFDVGALIA